LIVIVDQRVDDIAHRLFDLIAALSWNGPFEISYAELAWALCKSERVIIRKVNLLSKLGYIVVKRRANTCAK
jgi:hypothetical protein